MKLYSSKLAPSPLKVLIFLKEKGILDQVEIIDLDLGKLEHKTPEYKAIAPNSRVPALKLDDGTIILETTAICRYLESLYPDPNLFGENPIEIASIEMWYSRVTYELAVPLMHGFRHTHPHMSQMENQNQEYGLAQRELAVKSLDVYNKIIQKPYKVVVGNVEAVTGTYNGIKIDFITNANRLNVNTIIFNDE